ncbi:hypothetical protein E2C01_089409 [Portunus trituberculatus]|uniref:Uncharacterized protein n=1 Tax=Portunus trituberculatus TaxID=210409 RepID=A0A5B7JMB0_PORTR|nr:hypothetical protein [Portunus trituberculatus]
MTVYTLSSVPSLLTPSLNTQASSCCTGATHARQDSFTLRACCLNPPPGTPTEAMDSWCVWDKAIPPGAV